MNEEVRAELGLVEEKMEEVIKMETGVETEVTFIGDDQFTVSTEDIARSPTVKELISQVRPFVREAFYKADEDLPAAITFVFEK